MEDAIWTLLYLHDGDAEVGLFKTKQAAMSNVIKRIEDEIFCVQSGKIKKLIVTAIEKNDYDSAINYWNKYQNSLTDGRFFKFLELNIREK